MKKNVKSLVLAAAIASLLGTIATSLHAATDNTAAPVVQTQAADARYGIQTQLTVNPALNGTDVVATVSDDAVSLYGWVDSQQQHDEAVRIAQSYAGDRAVVDNITIGGSFGW